MGIETQNLMAMASQKASPTKYHIAIIIAIDIDIAIKPASL
jgi:hypothetical protein